MFYAVDKNLTTGYNYVFKFSIQNDVLVFRKYPY